MLSSRDYGIHVSVSDTSPVISYQLPEKKKCSYAHCKLLIKLGA